MDAVDRLRERAQNEQTVLALNAFCKQLEADLAKEREKVKELAHQKGALIDRADTYYQKLAAAQATIAEAADALEEAGRKLALARDALRLAGDEPNLDKARKIADTALAQIGEKQ